MHFRALKKTAGEIRLGEQIDVDKDGNALTLIDILPAEGNLAEEVDLRIGSELLRRKISECLDKRERRIIALRYGLAGSLPLTQREVARLEGSPEAMYQGSRKRPSTSCVPSSGGRAGPRGQGVRALKCGRNSLSKF